MYSGIGATDGLPPVEGGLGGDGQGPNFSEQLLDGGTIRGPNPAVFQFCSRYRLSSKIGKLPRIRNRRVLFQVSDAALKDVGFKTGYIAELGRCLAEYKYELSTSTRS
ncbi:hypothetical protein DFH08DRAFT_805860 [Mycena albidolilacea]|uniref:Uncharacterized protein n=1 Tax=Mycena albidolilacea TaxID=1033008 RepID=A0AAD7EUJ5_9AGAR|nr:hypothetical protein DFH08DRAFT_805860 [Mycena albidolilacea]